MKKVVATIILILCFTINGESQNSINDYKYVIVPHFYEFVQGKNVYRLNTITRFLLKKNGLNAYMDKELKAIDYRNNNCLALFADVVLIPSMLKTKLKIVLKNCDEEVVFESKVGESKAKTYEVAYKAALNQAFESLDNINYKYIPNSDVISRAEKNEAEEKIIEVEKEVEKLKAEIQELNEAKAQKNMVKEEISETPILEIEKQLGDFLYAKATNIGFELINNKSNKVDFILIKTRIENVFIVQDKNGIVYKKENRWIVELVDGEKIITSDLDIRF